MQTICYTQLLAVSYCVSYVPLLSLASCCIQSSHTVSNVRLAWDLERAAIRGNFLAALWHVLEGKMLSNVLKGPYSRNPSPSCSNTIKLQNESQLWELSTRLQKQGKMEILDFKLSFISLLPNKPWLVCTRWIWMWENIDFTASYLGFLYWCKAKINRKHAMQGDSAFIQWVHRCPDLYT